jgi:hypothetical protein
MFVFSEYEETDSKKDIPILPDCNIITPTSKLIVKNMDPFYNTKVRIIYASRVHTNNVASNKLSLE